TPVPDRRIALILANYPNKDGRLANGVGLDTPASVIAALTDMADAGYRIDDIPDDTKDLMTRIQSGPTNWLPDRFRRQGGERLPLADYRKVYDGLPDEVRLRVEDRWGAPEKDPFFDSGDFVLSIIGFGNVVLGMQPARGYNIDPKETYHDPDLVPPHNYFAFYIWLRDVFGTQAFVHMGKHGNMEWLPGKSLALSGACFPEAVFGPVPHIYPFIVNDPGEGTQAKRRAQAVIVGHMTPPLVRAETYGPLKDLEALVDEYFQAASGDPKRLKHLTGKILTLTSAQHLDDDIGINADDDLQTKLARIDTFLCDVKESQIRDGLHIFGRTAPKAQTDSLVVALARIPRRRGEDGDQSLIRALAKDLGLNDGTFDPLDCQFADPWTGPRPAVLQNISADPWRNAGDTVERLELLALSLAGGESADRAWSETGKVLDEIAVHIRPAVEASATDEMGGFLHALDGRHLPPGPSGAPTRGRLDVLPTGRNFYSLDSRTLPTPAAFNLGTRSAYLLMERHLQETGDWPKALTLTMWGTSNMRTGGDDIAQALALMGVRPTWDAASYRVTGFEILPLSLLDRPRVDVTVRISGFFRDAFPAQIDLMDSAARAVAERDEPADMNPAAARYREDRKTLGDSRAGARVFGSKPGAYGAGLQALIDERIWDRADDLAKAYLEWGSYVYGDGAAGESDRGVFETRLKDSDGVVHNQDNREHDLLDSDDYYQFEGGLTAAITHLKGAAPVVYHTDHSRPERPVIRTLDQEISRVMRARVVNPKWIDGMMRHGYKGAFEIAATVDYLFAFAATTNAVKGHHFDLVYREFLENRDRADFMAEHNPKALEEIKERLWEAVQRGLWQPRSNSARACLEEGGDHAEQSRA
ncbi:MAG: cobaltochelatase subunit CobN, partial [Rhodospirillales bacterium]|nr:cobaltochelatase subunit CobN [Rhodospirillales bacterium]